LLCEERIILFVLLPFLRFGKRKEDFGWTIVNLYNKMDFDFSLYKIFCVFVRLPVSLESRTYFLFEDRERSRERNGCPKKKTQALRMSKYKL
jgi:hypothetical protein